MALNPEELIQEVTRELSTDYARGYMTGLRDVRYRKMPDNFVDEGQPFWRVRLDLVFDSHVHIGLDLYGEIFLGRGKHEADFVALLSEDEAAQMGVSRRHAILRPTPTSLYLIDLGSTNGTKLNGHPTGLNIPYRLHDGDAISFGQLEFVVRIIKTPEAPITNTPEDLMEVVPEIAVAITGCLEQDEVLSEAMQLIQSYTAADGAGVWLVDEQTGELRQEKTRGDNSDLQSRVAARNMSAHKVMQTGQLVLNDSAMQQAYPKPVIYAPIKLGGVTFGVLSASRNDVHHQFSPNDQRLIEFVAEICAVAIQNARMYQAKINALKRYQRTLALVSDGLNYNMKQMVNNIVGNTSLLRDQISPVEDGYFQADDILHNSEHLMSYLEQLTDVVNLSQSKDLKQHLCDLVKITEEACTMLTPHANDKSITITFDMSGKSFPVAGHKSYLYRAISGLIYNGIMYTPQQSDVNVVLAFHSSGITLSVGDCGAAISEHDPAQVFENYGGGLRGTKVDSQLAIPIELTYAVVRAHDGTLMAENQADGRVVFTMTLPSHMQVAE